MNALDFPRQGGTRVLSFQPQRSVLQGGGGRTEEILAKSDLLSQIAHNPTTLQLVEALEPVARQPFLAESVPGCGRVAELAHFSCPAILYLSR